MWTYQFRIFISGFYCTQLGIDKYCIAKNTKKICFKNNWVTIDVTKKSIEEIAATVLEYYKIFKKIW